MLPTFPTPLNYCWCVLGSTVLYTGSMSRIVHKWAEFVIPMYAHEPELLTEMYGYAAAAAHLELPHQLMDSFTIEQTDSKGEGWSLVDAAITAQKDYCMDIRQFFPGPLPFTMHSCQKVSMVLKQVAVSFDQRTARGSRSDDRHRQ
jgi:hypothetical protein